jgi:hypothetical protein
MVYRGRVSRRIYLLGREKPLHLVEVDSVQSLSCFSRLGSDSDAVFVYNRDPLFDTLQQAGNEQSLSRFLQNGPPLIVEAKNHNTRV